MNIIKFNSGEEIVGRLINEDDTHYTIENAMKMHTIPKMMKDTVVESLGLTRWMYPYSEQSVIDIRKTSVLAILDASDGLVTFYNRQWQIATKDKIDSDWTKREFTGTEDELEEWEESMLERMNLAKTDIN